MSKCWERQEDLNLVLTPCGLLPGYSLTLILSARVSTNLIFSVCVALVLMNSRYCIILKVVLRGYWDPISCCTLICTLSWNTSVFFFFPPGFGIFPMERKGGQSFWLWFFSVVFFFFFNIGSHFTSKHLNCFSTAVKGKMTSTAVSKQNIKNIPLWFFFFLMRFYSLQVTVYWVMSWSTSLLKCGVFVVLSFLQKWKDILWGRCKRLELTSISSAQIPLREIYAFKAYFGGIDWNGF